jgi:hypothetical protein
MNEDKTLRDAWNKGWDCYWLGYRQDAYPDYETKEAQEEWICGWLTAQEASVYEADMYRGLTNPEESV